MAYTFSEEMKTTILLAILVMGFCALSAVAQSEEAQPRQVDQKEYLLGEADARRDLQQGKIVYEIVGQPSMIDQELKRIALKDYGVSVKFHGCAKGPRIDYDQGYLDTVVTHLKKKYSFDPIVKVERELRTRSREQGGGGQPATQSRQDKE